MPIRDQALNQFIFPEMQILYQKRSVIKWLVVWAILTGLAACAGSQPKAAKPSKYDVAGEPASVFQNPPPASHLDLEFALDQFKSSRFEVAEFYLKKSLMKEPDNPLALRFLPWAYFFQKRYDKALIAFERVLSHYPRETEPLIGMGWSYVAMNFYDRALEKFKKAQKRSPDSFEVHKGLGFCNLLLGKEKKAQFHFKKIYTFGERDDLEVQWEQWHDRSPAGILEVAPSDLRKPSLFTPPFEAPRYRSMLAVFPDNAPGQHPALEEAWRLFGKKLYNRALIAFQNLPEPVARTLDAQNGLGWAYLKTGNLKEAESVFGDSLNHSGFFIGTKLGALEVKRSLLAKASFAKHYFTIGKYRIAEKEFTRLNLNYPDWSYPESILGWIALKRGQEKAALNRFETALDKNPEDAMAKKGMSHLRGLTVSKVFQGDQKLREKDYKNASYLYFDYIDAHQSGPAVTYVMAKAYSGLGFSQIHKRQYRLAIQNFEKIRGRKGFEAHWTKGLGLSYYHLGEYEKAAQYLITADSLIPNQGDVVYPLDWSILRSWDAETAKDYFLTKARRKPLRASVYMGIGWIEYHKGDPDLGVEYFLKAISLDPDIANSEDFQNILDRERFGWQVYNHLGWAYYHRQDHENSVKMFTTALSQNLRSSEALKGLGYNYYKMEEWEKAESFLEKSIKRNPSPNPTAEAVHGSEPGVNIKILSNSRTKLARALMKMGKYKDALGHFQEERKRHPDWTEVHDGLGWAYLKLDRLPQAREAFVAALRHQPLNPSSHKGLKEVRYRLALGSL